jgi:hypothetical protein
MVCRSRNSATEKLAQSPDLKSLHLSTKSAMSRAGQPPETDILPAAIGRYLRA